MSRLCECGCGRETKYAYKTITRLGWVKGQQIRFIKGHAIRQMRVPSRAIIVSGVECCTIPLTQDQEAIVDKADYEWLSQWTWHARRQRRGNFYAVRLDNNHRTIWMHSLICPVLPYKVTDHRNGNTLDNRRINLRPAENWQNNINTPIVKGVSRFRGVRKTRYAWLASIAANGKRIYLGSFRTEEDAAAAYDYAAARLHGEFAHYNLEQSA